MVKTKKIGGGVWCPPSPFTKNFVFFKKKKREENKKKKKTVYSYLFLVFILIFSPEFFFHFFFICEKNALFFPLGNINSNMINLSFMFYV
jgi:hypothetical protein